MMKELTVAIIDDYAQELLVQIKESLHNCNAYVLEAGDLSGSERYDFADIYLLGSVRGVDTDMIYEDLVALYPEYSSRAIKIPTSREINRESVVFDWIIEMANELGCREVIQGKDEYLPYSSAAKSRLDIAAENTDMAIDLITEAFTELHSIYEGDPENFSEELLQLYLKGPLDKLNYVNHLLGQVGFGLGGKIKIHEHREGKEKS
ncbi:MAG: hypothetical protein FWE31_05780 [Firmicutes bacterium]|nr:hypothetical protein [Bacillota bacterium]